jgi:hypothetical protein
MCFRFDFFVTASKLVFQVLKQICVQQPFDLILVEYNEGLKILLPFHLHVFNRIAYTHLAYTKFHQQHHHSYQSQP